MPFYSPPPPDAWLVDEYASPRTDATSTMAPASTASFVRCYPYEWEAMLQSKRVAPRFRRVVVRPPPPRPDGGVGYAGRYDRSPFKVPQTACSVSMETTKQIGLGVMTTSQLAGWSGPGAVPFTGFNR